VKNNAQRQLNGELRLAWNALKNAGQQVPIAKDYADRSVKVRSAYQEQFSLGDRTPARYAGQRKRSVQRSRRYVELQFVDMFTTYRISARTGELLKSLNIQAPSAAQPLDQAQRTQAELPELK
jgi:adhesin transport system outer membrane protein